MSEQKLYKNGNSIAVTVPKEYLQKLGLRDGSRVMWEMTKKGPLLTVEQAKRKASDINPKVARLIEKISKKYSQVWHDLAKI